MKTVEITREKLQTLTDSGSWDRGIGYFEQGRVFRLMIDRGTVVARIMGTHEYEVTLWADEDDLHGRCTCPMGDAGVFCKHCVATGLECLDKGITELSAEGQPTEGTAPGEKEMDDAITDMEDIREYLRTEDTEELVEMIVAQAKADGALLRRLAARAALSAGEGLDIEAYKRAISKATSSMGFVDYADAFGFASAMDEVVDEIGGLLEEGHADEVVELSEYAMGEVEGALDHVDDSSGWMGDALYRLQELHREACTAAKPDPRELAGRLFRREVTSDYDVFSGAAETYADVLGEEGLAEYRKLAEGRWEELTPLKPGDKGPYDSPRYRLTRIMESLAEASGDLDELVAIKSRDLSTPYRYLEIAEVYRRERRYNKAMEWAEKGLAAFPDRPDSRLREFLANEYHRRSRHEEAMELVWNNFAEQPHLGSYRQLAEHAERAGEWPRWRERALSLMREQADHRKAEGRRSRWDWEPPAGSHLVDVYLREEDLDAAWQCAQEYGCSREQRLELASLREGEQPEEAVEIYQGEVRRLVELTKNAAYRDATRLVRRIQKLIDRLDHQEEFEQYIETLRTEFRRKRNFMKMLSEFE